MDVNVIYEIWQKNVHDAELLSELKDIKDNENEKYDRFSKNLEFGTAGLRAIMGVGTNRMNIYTVRLASQAFADYINAKYQDANIVISFDSRERSELFAHETARVMAANNIKTFITESLQPTPFLSFAVRNLKAQGGIMITASHNTAQYNGYKCYGEDGAQLSERFTHEIHDNMCNINIFEDVKTLNFENALESNLISFVPEHTYEKYINCVLSQRINKISLADLKVVYTPLNGAGGKMVEKILKHSDVQNLYVVPEQKYPDGRFLTCPYPNPEIESAFMRAMELAQQKDSDLILATDPDADRLGVCIRYGDAFRVLSGNEIGILLFHYIVSQRGEKNLLPEHPLVIKTIVSSCMVDAIAKDYNCEIREVLTGFKNIAFEILKLERNGEEDRYIFGFEESNGYLSGIYARDKDAISALLLFCEFVAYCRKHNIGIQDYLDSLFERYGFYKEKTLSFEFNTLNGRQKIDHIMESIRCRPNSFFNDLEVLSFEDYSKYTTSANVVCFNVGEHDKIIVRPSGTEPKIKFYIMLQSKNDIEIEYKFKLLETCINNGICGCIN